MNNEILKQLLRMSRYVLYGMVLHSFMCTMLIAADSKAQKSIDEIYFSVSNENTSLENVFQQIERETGFSFSYDEALLRKKNNANLNIHSGTLREVLTSIAQQAHLRFKRVDENIYVLKQPKQVNTQQEKLVEEPDQVRISGKVTSVEGNEALPGVSILIKGTSQGTTTDIEGNYSLSASEGSILQFSYIGFITQEITITNQSTLNVTLSPDLAQLEEVVVVGYGTQKKSDLTSAIASVKAEDIAQRITPRLDEALQGQMAGVSVQQTSGVPGNAPLIRIRGVGSITGGNAPLFVIDGFPVENNSIVGNLNMNDVESVEVLKDAASAAIYGSRGSNGVVLITTKKGQAGKLKVNINSFYGTQEGERFLEYMDGNAVGQMMADHRNQLWVAQGGNANDPNDVRPPNRRIDPQWTSGNQPTFGGNDFIFRSAAIQNHSISLSGGTNKTSFFISMDYLKQDGIIKGTSFERFSGRINIESQLNKRIKIGVNLSPSYSSQIDRGTEGRNGALDRVLTLGPLIDLNEIYYNPETRLTTSDYAQFYDLGARWHAVHALRFTTAPDYRRRPQILSNSFLEVDLIEGLKFRTSVGLIHNGFNQERNFDISAGGGVAQAYRTNNWGTNWLWENTLNYTKTLDKHTFSAIVGYTSQKDTRKSTSLGARDFPNNLALTINNANEINSWSESVNEWSLISALARFTYNYDDRYFLSASIRRDGSSRFGKNNRWGTFSSLSGAWRISEESFLADNNTISNLKLRASWGQTGNNLIGNYSAIAGLRSVNAPFGDNEVSQPGLVPSGFANEDLGWEKTTAINLGVDVGLVDDRISLSTEIYRNRTSDLLLNVPIPQVTGFDNALNNIGEVENRGFEIDLYTRNLVGDFKWNTRFNFSNNQNEVLSLGNNDTPIISGEWFARVSYTGVGRPIGTFYMLEQEGIFQNQAEVDAGAVFGNEGPGDVKLRDVNGDGTITDDDRNFFGQPFPIWNFGITNEFSYKNFDLSIFINGAGGHQTYYIGGRIHDRSFADAGGKSYTANWADRWQSESNPGDGKTPDVASRATTNSIATSRWLYDSDWWRIKNITLGYTLPSTMTQKLSIESFRIYTTVDNLFLNTDYPGANPEGVGMRGESVSRSAGYDYGAYPLSRRVVFGVNIGF